MIFLDNMIMSAIECVSVMQFIQLHDVNRESHVDYAIERGLPTLSLALTLLFL